MTRPRLLFISPRYLFPADSGGKIRTTSILRGLKGGHFHITLASPMPEDDSDHDVDALTQVCDRLASWTATRRGTAYRIKRVASLLDRMPVAVASDRSAAGRRLVSAELRESPALVVVDFPHAAVLLPATLAAAAVLFTHNIEAEIFERHAMIAQDSLRRALWRMQTRKMQKFERETTRRFDTVVAVSERDSAQLGIRYGVERVRVIPTGVDLEYFQYRPRRRAQDDADTVVFTGSMDWLANIDGIAYFMDSIWPLIQLARPGARMVVVGRSPPERLVNAARERGLPWHFTGFVDDVRPFVYGADIFVIPLRVGGGTRIKAFEAMAMGCPVVSTSIGVEGLPVRIAHDYEGADTPETFARAVIRLIDDSQRRQELAANARHSVESKFSAQGAARVFEEICIAAHAQARRRTLA